MSGAQEQLNAREKKNDIDKQQRSGSCDVTKRLSNSIALRDLSLQHVQVPIIISVLFLQTMLIKRQS